MGRTSLAIGLGALAIAAGALVLVAGDPRGWLEAPAATQLYTRWLPPQVPPSQASAQSSSGSFELAPAERDALARLPIRGSVVWSSNRSGNHELYLAHTGDGAVTQLTAHPHVDYFSRFSPDGSRILFLRSQRPWVSFRESDAWDLHVMNADGTGEQRLAEGAYNPSWMPDGSGIIFMRDNRLIRLRDGIETVVHDGANEPTGGTLYDPQVGPGGVLAVTLRDAPRNGVGLVDLRGETFRLLADGCHISWIPGRSELVWVDPHGKGGTEIVHAAADGRGHETLIDLPGSYSHEYFPRPSNDGRWLIWGASEGGHEHDRADYEIFVWEMGTPWESAVRLTFSPANDQWPDLFITDSANGPPRP